MKIQKQIIVAIVLALFSTSLFAEQVIAVVSLEKAAVENEYALEQIEKWRGSEEFKTKFENFKSLQDKIKSMQEDAKINGLTWSDEQKTDFQKKMQSAVTDYQFLGKQIEQGKSEVEKKIFSEVSPQFEIVIPEIIKERKIDLLLDARTAKYVGPGLDITDELIERLNKVLGQ